MRTFFTLIIITGIFAGDLMAQQLPLFNVYRDHWNVLNPAALSNNYLINNKSKSIGVSYRNQWLGLPESPETQLLNFELVSDKRNSVIGGHILNDQTGKIGQTGIYGNYAYRIQLGKKTTQSLLIGLSAGIVQYSARLSEVEFFDVEEQSIQDDDILYPDFGLGIFYHYADKYYFGVSVPQTFSLNTQFQTSQGKFGIDRIQHLYFVGGGYFQVSWFGNETSFVEPSVWVKYVPDAPLNIDLNFRAQISELIWAGLGGGFGFGDQTSSRLLLEAGVLLGEQINLETGQLKVGLGFDIPMTGFGAVFGNSIEANVVYSF